MSVMTIRLPDDTAERLKSLARSRGVSVNKMIEDLSVRAITAWDTENSFRAMAAKGDPVKALDILARLDAREATPSRSSTDKA